jgi:hypothetical protein
MGHNKIRGEMQMIPNTNLALHLVWAWEDLDCISTFPNICWENDKEMMEEYSDQILVPVTFEDIPSDIIMDVKSGQWWIPYNEDGWGGEEGLLNVLRETKVGREFRRFLA